MPYRIARFRPGTFEEFAARLSRGDEITGSDLALVLETNPDAPLPPQVREYFIRWLRGEVKPRRGRKPAPSGVGRTPGTGVGSGDEDLIGG